MGNYYIAAEPKRRSKLVVVPFEQAAAVIQDGDLLLFQKQDLVGHLISRFGASYYTHVGVAAWENGHVGTTPELMIYDISILRGGSATLLRAHAKFWPGCIDVYRVSPYHTVIHWDPDDECLKERRYTFDGHVAVSVMRKFCAPGVYGWWSAFRLGLSRMPLLSLLTQPPTDDEIESGYPPSCSHAVSYAVRKAFTDMVHGTPDMLTHPGDIARSPLTHYLFTLGAPTK